MRIMQNLNLRSRLNSLKAKLNITPYEKSADNASRIHFMSTASSDAILLESNGHFALVDAAEDSDNPRGFPELEYEGYEDRVLEYLKENAADERGKVHLDFVLGTHSHSDHIGGFDTVIADPDIEIGRAYLKKYNASKIRSHEVEKWDNQEVYDQMINALEKRGVPVISDMNSEPFMLGDFKITLFNTKDPAGERNIGENDNSLGVLVERSGVRIFLAGDIDNKSGDEDRLAPQIGKVDILKIGHHSYAGSTSESWLEILSPKVCVVTNDYERTDKNTLSRILRTVNSPIILTGTENGIVVQINGKGNIEYYNDIHKKSRKE